MSHSYGPIIEYRCTCDCKQSGCPGHKMQAVFHSTSDTIEIFVDGESRFLMDDNQLMAIEKAVWGHVRSINRADEIRFRNGG